jgi:outer membrane protein assembly factor BamE (lipoprotein component of BamABCDE complex)
MKQNDWDYIFDEMRNAASRYNIIRKSLLTALLIFIFILASCHNNYNKNESLQEMRLGKNLIITISNDEIIDAEYLQKVFDGEIKKEALFFNMLDNTEFKNMINYMKQNNYMIVAGQYTINQAWRFEDGLFIMSNGEKRKVVEFKTICKGEHY